MKNSKKKYINFLKGFCICIFQIRWLNEYHKKVLEEVGEKVLNAGGKTEAYEWVVKRTKEIPEDPSSSKASNSAHSFFMLVTLSVGFLFKNLI